MTLQETILAMVQKHTPHQMLAAKVVAVDAETVDVDPIDGGPTLYNVRLRPTEDNSDLGIVPMPAMGSLVLVGLLHNNPNSAFVTLASKCTSYKMQMESGAKMELDEQGCMMQMDSGATMELDEQGCRMKMSGGAIVEMDDQGNIELNGNNLGGLIEINKLAQEVAKNSAFLLAIKQTLYAWPVTPNDGGAALKTFAFSQLDPQNTADLSNVTNDKVKHGSV